jgi:wyosine [tRNA(Phe)-imidazoG37] synthetase (radical SAM superfamily)
LRKEPVAVLTNASLLDRKQVRKELSCADLVAVKLDADCEKVFKLLNHPAREITFSRILKGIRQFRKEYRGKLALQIMFTCENERKAVNLAKLAQGIQPDEIQINTPARPSAAQALSPYAIARIKGHFRGMNVLSLYEARRKRVRAISAKDTMLRRGKNLE